MRDGNFTAAAEASPNGRKTGAEKRKKTIAGMIIAGILVVIMVMKRRWD